jgi:hypothetical protein
LVVTSCELRGGDGIRTRVHGFAGRCLASRPRHRGYDPLLPMGRTRADDEIRTRDPHLGKVMRYHCATSALLVIADVQGNPSRPLGGMPNQLPRACLSVSSLLAPHARQRFQLWQDGGARAIGAVGSALPSHGRGHRFESGIAHHIYPEKLAEAAPLRDARLAV